MVVESNDPVAGVCHNSLTALVCNPLYVGSFMMMFGFCILMIVADMPVATLTRNPQVQTDLLEELGNKR